MLKMKAQTEFLVEEDDLPDPLEDEFEDFDFMLFTQLEDAREVIFQILQNRSLPMVSRMALLMDMARDMQECIDEDRLFDMQDVVEEYRETYLSLNADVLTGIDRYMQIKEGFEVYPKLERLREEWTEVLEGAGQELFTKGYSYYEEIYKDFEENYLAVRGEDWDIFLEQILTFFLYTYFCGAVYDDCIYSKVAMSVMSVCYIQEFIMYGWHKNGHQMDEEECIRMAYRYAREIEHSDLNLNDLEQWLMDRM